MAELDEKSLPKSGIVFVKATTLAALVKRARRPIKGTQGQITVKTADDAVTIGLASAEAEAGEDTMEIIATCIDDSEVLTARRLTISGVIDGGVYSE